jgi:hypothetical protein
MELNLFALFANSLNCDRFTDCFTKKKKLVAVSYVFDYMDNIDFYILMVVYKNMRL